MNIVVRGANWIGDAVMTIPALRVLRKSFPDSKITLHTREWAEGIFRDADFIDELLTYQPEKSTLKTVRKQAEIWRGEKFDLAVLFPNSFESALLAKFGKVPTRFGYAKEGRSLLLTDAIEIPVWKNGKHEIFYYINLIGAVEKKYHGAETLLKDEPHFNLMVSEQRKAEARHFLTENGVDLSKKLIAFVAGSTNSRAKRWQTDSYARLNDEIQRQLEANVILIGAGSELEVSQEIYEKSRVKPIILTGKTNLALTTAILSICDATVSNDTGPAHISAALGIKTIVIFGPTNPATTQPWNSEIIRKDVECAPCMLRDCPIDHRCLTRISADEVFNKLLSVI